MARLLVVDDEQSMRVMLEARLAKAGHAVEVAPDVIGVERALAASEFDVVITDLRMRTGGGGLAALPQGERGQGGGGVILLTALGGDGRPGPALGRVGHRDVGKWPPPPAPRIAL